MSISDNKRFSTVDNQLNIMAEWIGDGRIEGWEIQTQTFPEVKVTKGNGFIDKYYVNTFDDKIIELDSGGVFNFFLQRKVGVLATVGPRSDVVSLTYNDLSIPETPISFNVVAGSDSSFSTDLSWNSNSEVDLDHYDLERSLNPSSSFSLVSAIPKTGVSYTDSVNEDTTYYYRLYAVDQSGFRSLPASGSVTTTLSPILPPNPVSVLMPSSENAINVLWRRPIGIPFTSINRWNIEYVQLRSDGSEIDLTRVNRSVDRSKFVERIDDLQNGTTYRVILTTIDTKGRESTGIVKNVTPQPSVAPQDPQNIDILETEGPSGVIVNMNWNDGSDEYDPLIPYRYNIYITVDGQGESVPINVPIGFSDEQVELYSFDMLEFFPIPQNALVTFRITSVTENGIESRGNYVRFITSNFAEVMSVSNLLADFNVDTGKITVTWDNRIDTSDVNINVTEENLADEYPSGIIADSTLGLAERFVFDALLNHRYTISVTASNIDGVSSSPSVIVKVTLNVSDVDSPFQPENLLASPGDRQIRLSWSPSITDSVSSYNIYRNRGSISFISSDWSLVDSVPKTILQFEDYGLDNNQVYSYYVTSVNIFGQESLNLPDGINLNFVESTPRPVGILTEPSNVTLNLVGNDITITWESLLEESDSFTVYRSIDNLHLWKPIANVNRNITTYVDEDIPLIDGTTFYYSVGKSINDADVVVQISDIPPENSIFIGRLSTGVSSFGLLDIASRRDIADLLDPISELTNAFLLSHRHTGIELSPERIDLDPELVITAWDTVDGKIFTTEERDIDGLSQIVKVNGRFPSVFFTVDVVTRRIIFSEPIMSVDDSGNIIGDLPNIEMRVLGLEEVQGILASDRFKDIHARQVQFGRINKAHMPGIGHEGRIKEKMLPKTFLLERFSDHLFTVSESNTDSTKNFGNGTTFFSVIEGDGLIDEVVDFDQELDGSLVAFRKPSFSTTTVSNLKTRQESEVVNSSVDNASEHRLTIGDLFSIGNIGFTSSEFFIINRSNLSVGSIGSPSSLILAKDITIYSRTNSILVLSHTVFAPTASIWEIDAFAGTSSKLGDILMPSGFSVTKFDAMEYNPDDDLVYLIASNERLTYIDLQNPDGSGDFQSVALGSLSIGSSGSYGGMAYDSLNKVMYAASSLGVLWSVNLSNGFGTKVHTTNTLSASYSSMAYDHNNSKMYGVDGFVGSSPTQSRLYEVNTTSGTDSLLGTYTDPSTQGTHGIASPPSDMSLWNNEFSVGYLGKQPGSSADYYVRFPVNVDQGSTIESSVLQFTSHDSVSGSGGVVNVKITALDPDLYADSVTLATESLKTVSDLGTSINWSIPSWGLSQSDSDSAISVTSVIQEFVDMSTYVAGSHIILKIQTLDSTAIGNYRSLRGFATSVSVRPELTTNFVLDIAEVDSSVAFQSEKSYHFQFEFVDSSETRWVRVTTFDTAIKPNPIVDLKKRISFRIMTSKTIRVALGIRELTLSEAVVGNNGGSSGPIEWIGVDSQITVIDDDGSSVPMGKVVEGKEGVWQLIEFDPERDTVENFLSGDSLLNSPFGVLEHIAFTIDSTNPDSSGQFDIYIDKIQQVDDVLVSGTSQGILISRDFGSSWNLSRLVETPVHKFYKAKNNPFVWAVSANSVLLSVDLNNWFETSGLSGVQFIRDIIEDNVGNMFVSTDRGVYWLEIALINNFSSWRQTQPISAFTTDCYGMYYNDASSGASEVWVSTEIGIFKTLDNGDSWHDTGMKTQGLPAYDFINISSDLLSPNIISITRKHVLRKLGTETDFSVLANFEVQHNIFDIWTMEYFSGRIYVSTGKGVFVNAIDDLFTSNLNIVFDNIFPGLNFNGSPGVAFGLDTIQSQGEDHLFIGQENRLMKADENNVLSIKEQFPNKELPSFFANDNELVIGYVYNAFNNVICFRERQPVNTFYKSAYLPRKVFIPVNGGWAQSNAEADVFIYVNGIPTWLDFKLDEGSILSNIQILEGKLNGLIGTTNEFNSLVPDAEELLSKTLSDISVLKEGGIDGTSLINRSTISNFLENDTRFISLVTSAFSRNADVQDLPLIRITGFPRDQRVVDSRSSIFEVQEDFEANNATGININTVDGEVDFLTIFTSTTNLEDKLEYVFNKYDKVNISIFNANVQGTGEFTHSQLEDKMEDLNTGLTSHLSRAFYGNLIKTGIFIEKQHNFIFDTVNASNVQSKFLAAHTNDWYDIVNSTVDYKSIIKVANVPESRIANKITFFVENPYLLDRIWISTDNDIIQYDMDTNTGDLTAEKILRPGGGPVSLFVWDVFVFNEDDIYVVAEEKDSEVGHIFRTVDAGNSWTELETINLPQKIYAFVIYNGNKIAATESGIFYSDNDFGTWFPSNLPSGQSAPSAAFSSRVINMDLTTFLIVESDRWFFTSGGGIDWFSLSGQMVANNVSVINKVARFNNLTWIGTDKGIYNDGNSILSDRVQFGLQTDLEDTVLASTNLHISDIAFGENTLYCSSGEGKIYCFTNEEWLSYDVVDTSTIHKISVIETSLRHNLIIASHNKVQVIDVTPGSGVFG